MSSFIPWEDGRAWGHAAFLPRSAGCSLLPALGTAEGPCVVWFHMRGQISCVCSEDRAEQFCTAAGVLAAGRNGQLSFQHAHLSVKAVCFGLLLLETDSQRGHCLFPRGCTQEQCRLFESTFRRCMPCV